MRIHCLDWYNLLEIISENYKCALHFTKKLNREM